MDIKKIKSIAFLGWHFARHCAKRVLGRSRTGLPAFLAHYRNDRIFAINGPTRAQMTDTSRCYVCRLCDAACPNLATLPQALPPSFVAASFSRSLTDYSLFSPEALACGMCRDCEDACPQDVPLTDMIAFMRARADEFRKA